MDVTHFIKLTNLTKQLCKCPINIESMLQEFLSVENDFNQMASGICVYFITNPSKNDILTQDEAILKQTKITTFDQFKLWACDAMTFKGDQATLLHCKLYNMKATNAITMNWTMGFCMAWSEHEARLILNNL